jgi:hypothetical protein
MAKSYLYPPQPTVSITTGPIEQVFDGVPSPVEYDSANPANNKPLASGMFFIKDGNFTPVLEDTITPANNEPLPVKLTGVTGDVIINAGDLNVSTSATNDSMAIGDAVTGQLAKVDLNDDTTTYALKVKDDDANTALSAIQTATAGAATEATLATLATEATLDDVKTAVESIALEDFATLTEQQLQTNALTQIVADTQNISAAINEDGNPAGPEGLMIGGKDSSGDFQQVSVNTAGELSVTFGLAGFATETTLSDLNNKVANNYGAATGAVRSASQIGNASGQADFNSGADSAQTLRVSANLKRNGNELSYNSGAADANTPRVSIATGSDIKTSVDAVSAQLPSVIGQNASADSLSVVLANDASLPVDQTSFTGGIINAQVTVGLTAVRAAVNGASAPSSTRKKLLIKPSKNNTGSVYLGSSTVTTANGLEIIGPDRLEFPFDASDYYLISDTAAQVVEIVEVD